LDFSLFLPFWGNYKKIRITAFLGCIFFVGRTQNAKELFMKKSKLLVLGIIALMLTGGLVLASCGGKCSSSGGCSVTTSGDGSKKFSGCAESKCASWKSYQSGSAASPCDC
jgi:hypothetical protein